jgi:hypothetical protein
MQTAQARGHTSYLPEQAGTTATKFFDALVNMIFTPVDSDEHDAREQLELDPKYLDPGEWNLPNDFIVLQSKRKSPYSEEKYLPAGLSFRFDEHPHTPLIEFKLSFDKASVYETPSKQFRVYRCYTMTDQRYRKYSLNVYFLKSSEKLGNFLFYGTAIPLDLLRSILEDASRGMK